ncbi:MAG TPA: DUF6600 domain-containing protein [Candidatus Angelobacter sp.]|jgi:hypothetical protein|nr:DUF6600 domain-containing protein [Candidatus Angelobacter sp.]
MLPRHRFLLAAIFLFMLSALTSFAYADSQARIVRLSYVEGDVQLAHQGSGFENATLNVPIVQGDQLRAGSSGWAEVEFEDGSTIRLSPGTALVFSELRLLSNGGTATSVDVDQGEAEFKVNHHDQGEFNVTARNKTIVLKHSSRFRVTTLNSAPLEVAVWKGEVDVQDPNSGQEITVKKKETFALDLLDPARYDLEKGVESDGLDQWSTQRDEYLSTYAKSNYSNSPYQYGVSDLNYYGQYYNVPGYGNMWQPYGVNAGWDPFANGYWNFTPGGYVWVSAYPWGWMPYRFGHWQFVNGYGWLWRPPSAGYWSTWNYCPPVFNAPAGFQAPVPPAVRIAGNGVAGGSKPGTVTSGNGGSTPGVRFLGPPESSGPHPPVKTAGPGGSRTFVQPEPPTPIMSRGGNGGDHTGNPGTGHTAGDNAVGVGSRRIGPPEQPGMTNGNGVGSNIHGSGGAQQHTPPQPPVQTSAPPQPARMPPTPAPAVHPQVTSNPPPRPQYTPPPAPAIHPAPMPPAPMVHSSPAPASGGSLSHGRPR